jgi:hypothetical protein
MARKNKFASRPNRQLSETQSEIAEHWQGSVSATAKFLFLEPRTVVNALRSSRLRKMVYGETSAAADARAANIKRLKAIAENLGGKFSTQQVLDATIELEKTFARLERQTRLAEANAARAKTPQGADPTQPGTDDPHAQWKRDLAERAGYLKAAIARDVRGKATKAAPWLFDDDNAPKAAAPVVITPPPVPSVPQGPRKYCFFNATGGEFGGRSYGPRIVFEVPFGAEPPQGALPLPDKPVSASTEYLNSHPQHHGAGAVDVEVTAPNRPVIRTKEENEQEVSKFNAGDHPVGIAEHGSPDYRRSHRATYYPNPFTGV